MRIERVALGAVIAVIVYVATVGYAFGVFTQKLDSIDDRVVRIEQLLDGDRSAMR